MHPFFFVPELSYLKRLCPNGAVRSPLARGDADRHRAAWLLCDSGPVGSPRARKVVVVLVEAARDVAHAPPGGDRVPLRALRHPLATGLSSLSLSLSRETDRQQ